MKIAIMSDAHDNWQNLTKAIKLSNENKCEYILFAGDLISPPTLGLFEAFTGNVKYVWGNNENEKVGMIQKASTLKKIELCGDFFDGEVGGLSVFMNHYPKFAQLAHQTNNYDLCIYGHTHEYFLEKGIESIIINPGEIHGYKTNAPSFVIFDTVIKEVLKINL